MEQQTLNDYILSLFEVCEILSKSSRTVSRYVKNGVLRPMEIKSRQGTLEYRFSKSEVDALRAREDQARQISYLPNFGNPVICDSSLPIESKTPIETRDGQDKVDTQIAASPKIESQPIGPETKQDRAIIDLLKGTTEMLRDQLKVKDDQIKNLDDKIGQLIERNRETNILLKGLQDKMVMLGPPKPEKNNTEQPPCSGATENVPIAAMDKSDKTGQTGADAGGHGERVKKEKVLPPKDKIKKVEKRKEAKPAPKKGFFAKIFS